MDTMIKCVHCGAEFDYAVDFHCPVCGLKADPPPIVIISEPDTTADDTPHLCRVCHSVMYFAGADEINGAVWVCPNDGKPDHHKFDNAPPVPALTPEQTQRIENLFSRPTLKRHIEQLSRAGKLQLALDDIKIVIAHLDKVNVYSDLNLLAAIQFAHDVKFWIEDVMGESE